MSDDIIKRALGMGVQEPVENAVVTYQPVIEEEDLSDDIDKDIQFAHDNMVDLIAQGSEALSELILIAKQSQHPRAFEVVANLLKTNADLNSDLIALHKKKQDLKPKTNVSVSPNGSKTVNNNLFVGSTAELQKMLKEMNKNGEGTDQA